MSREKGASVSTQLEQLHTCLPFRLSSHLCAAGMLMRAAQSVAQNASKTCEFGVEI